MTKVARLLKANATNNMRKKSAQDAFYACLIKTRVPENPMCSVDQSDKLIPVRMDDAFESENVQGDIFLLNHNNELLMDSSESGPESSVPQQIETRFK